MILPHFSLLQFAQWFLSFPLLSTLINSAAPASLYSCKCVERGGLKTSLKCMSLIIFTLSCPERRGLSPRVPHLGWVPKAWRAWSWARTPTGTSQTNLQASPGGYCWGHGSAGSLRAREFPLRCLQEVGTSVQVICLYSPGAAFMKPEQGWLRAFWLLLFLLICFFPYG